MDALNSKAEIQVLSTSAHRSQQAWSRTLACLIFLGLAGGLPVLPINLLVSAAQAQAVPAAVRRAQSLLDRGLVNDAIAAFQQALRSSPQSVEAKLGLAIAYQRAGRDADAWNAYQQVLAQDPNNQRALREVGVLGGYRPEWQTRGIEALTTLLNLNPNDTQARAQRALLLGYQGRYGEALTEYQIPLQGNPSPEVLLGAAQTYTYSGDSQQGLALFQRYLATGKTIPIYQIPAYAQALRETGNPDRAIQVLTQALGQSQKFPGMEIEIRSGLAQAYQANQQIEEALAALQPLRGKKEAALPLARALTTIGRRERRTDLYSEGVTLYRQVLASTSQPSFALVKEVADVLSELPSGRAAALELYQQLTAQQPNNKSLLVKQLVLESQLGRISRTELQQRLLSTLQPLPSDAGEQRALALSLLPLDPPDPALLSVYQSLLDAGVNVPFLNFRVAQMLIQQNELEAAKRALAAYSATAIGASDLSSELLLAEIDRRQGNYEASARRYESIIERNPSDNLVNSALRGLAGIRVQEGRVDDALALYDQLLQRNPDDQAVRLGRTALAYQTDRISEAEAETVLNQWLQTQSATDAPPELFTLVGALPPSLEREELYNALLAIKPDNTAVQIRRLQVIAARDPEQAKAEIAQLIARDPDNINVYFVQGELAIALEDFELASQAYQEILKREPDNTGALMALAGVRFTQQRFAEAAQIYNRVLELEPNNLMARQSLAELKTAQDQPFAALERFRELNAEQQAQTGMANPELVNRIQRLEVDILKRRGFQPYWERY